MPNRPANSKFDHALNLFVSYEQKKALEDLASQHHRSLAQIVRTLLHIGVPILKGFLEAEEQFATEGHKILVQSRRSAEDLDS
jgi:hypothetical protein